MPAAYRVFIGLQVHIELSRKTFALSSIISCSLLSRKASLIAGKDWAVTMDVKEGHVLLFIWLFYSVLFLKTDKSARAKERFGEEMV